MRTYEVRTYGCQMNVHDSERLSGLLEEAGYVACAGRRGRRRGRLQHLRGAGERRQQALRQPRPPGADEGEAARACRSPSAAAWRRRTARRSPQKAPWVDVVFGTHNIGSLPALLERARVQDEAQVEILESLEVFPSHAADQARVGVRRLGVGERRLQQHLHVLHRPGAARQGEGPPARRDPRRDRGAGRRGRQRGHPARPERQRLRRRVRRPPGVLQAAARVRRRRRPGAGAVHQPAPGRVHRRRHRGDGRDAERDAQPAHAAAVRLRPRAARRCGAPTARRSTSASSTGSAPPSPTPRSPPTSSSASRARPRTDFQATLEVVREARFAGAFTFQYSKRPGTPAATLPDQVAPTW